MTVEPLDQDDPNEPFLVDIQEAALGAIRLTRGINRDAFANDFELLSSVERSVQIIGRSATFVDPALRDAHPEIPWRRLIGAARVLDDTDDALEPDDLWALLRDYPSMVRAIGALIPDEQTDW